MSQLGCRDRIRVFDGENVGYGLGRSFTHIGDTDRNKLEVAEAMVVGGKELLC